MLQQTWIIISGTPGNLFCVFFLFFLIKFICEKNKKGKYKYNVAVDRLGIYNLWNVAYESLVDLNTYWKLKS